jgi:hypothetical protein
VRDPAIVVNFLLEDERSLHEKLVILNRNALTTVGPTFEDLIASLPGLFKTIPGHDRKKVKALSFVIETLLHARLNVTHHDTVH